MSQTGDNSKHLKHKIKT